MTYMESSFSITVKSPGDIPEVIAMREAIGRTEPDATGCRISIRYHPNWLGTLMIVSEGRKRGAWTSTFIGDEDRAEAIHRVLSGRSATMEPLPENERIELSSNAFPRAWWEKKRLQREAIEGAKHLGITVSDWLAMKKEGLV